MPGSLTEGTQVTDVWSSPEWLRATASQHGRQGRMARERLKELFQQQEQGRALAQSAQQFAAGHAQQERLRRDALDARQQAHEENLAARTQTAREHADQMRYNQQQLDSYRQSQLGNTQEAQKQRQAMQLLQYAQSPELDTIYGKQAPAIRKALMNAGYQAIVSGNAPPQNPTTGTAGASPAIGAGGGLAGLVGAAATDPNADAVRRALTKQNEPGVQAPETAPSPTSVAPSAAAAKAETQQQQTAATQQQQPTAGGAPPQQNVNFAPERLTGDMGGAGFVANTPAGYDFNAGTGEYIKKSDPSQFKIPEGSLPTLDTHGNPRTDAYDVVNPDGTTTTHYAAGGSSTMYKPNTQQGVGAINDARSQGAARGEYLNAHPQGAGLEYSGGNYPFPRTDIPEGIHSKNFTPVAPTGKYAAEVKSARDFIDQGSAAPQTLKQELANAGPTAPATATNRPFVGSPELFAPSDLAAPASTPATAGGPGPAPTPGGTPASDFVTNIVKQPLAPTPTPAGTPPAIPVPGQNYPIAQNTPAPAAGPVAASTPQAGTTPEGPEKGSGAPAQMNFSDIQEPVPPPAPEKIPAGFGRLQSPNEVVVHGEAPMIPQELPPNIMPQPTPGQQAALEAQRKRNLY